MASLLDQLLGNAQDAPNSAQQILSARFQPSGDDVAQSILRNTTGFNANAGYTPQSPQQVYGQNQTAMIQPYDLALQAQQRELANNITAQTGLPLSQADLQQKLQSNAIQQQTGLPAAQAGINLQNAQAGYYGNSLQRDLAEKAFQYANDPQMAQARAMAAYMQTLSGGSPQGTAVAPIAAPTPGDANPAAGTPIPAPPTPSAIQGSPALNQAIQQNGAPQGGFSPMGAMLAKQLGLTDMQIGPNGQPMPIPGSMKVENGSVISFDKDGKPQSNIPVNPRAQGLFEQKLQDINDNLDKLHAIGGTVEENPQKGWLTDIPLAGSFLENKTTQLAATDKGQAVLQGTAAQTLRDNINADVKQALPLYMQAFGITPGMERAQAAQQMLQDAIGGSLSKSLQHTKSNLRNLSQTAGTGQLAQNFSALDAAKTAISSGADRAAVIQRLQGAGINPTGL